MFPIVELLNADSTRKILAAIMTILELNLWTIPTLLTLFGVFFGIFKYFNSKRRRKKIIFKRSIYASCIAMIIVWFLVFVFFVKEKSDVTPLPSATDQKKQDEVTDSEILQALENQYPKGSAAFSTSPAGLIVPIGSNMDDAIIDWSKASIEYLANNKINVFLPDIFGNIGGLKGMKLRGNCVALKREVGYSNCTSFGFPDRRLCITILSISKGKIIIGLGVI